MVPYQTKKIVEFISSKLSKFRLIKFSKKIVFLNLNTILGLRIKIKNPFLNN